ncbi:MAG TPA: hypothetical protein DCQ64_13685 [Candidatus Rokubacteria bacterium]|nr:hypothetical protein [Candidatus Rokubacteria bacterium]
MARTCNITYKGIAATGVKFTVLWALLKQRTAYGGEEPSDTLTYGVEVRSPTDDKLDLPEWSNRSLSLPISLTTAPLVQAEADMLAVLQAAGATNIVEA